MTPAVAVVDLEHRYGHRRALAGLGFEVGAGELFGVLGPNGGGKSTLFRVLATLLRPTAGRAQVAGYDVVAEPANVRRVIGVVFQHPSVDTKLTVAENLRHHGRLHGLGGRTLAQRSEEMLHRFGLQDRADELVERLSGGLARRVELAKGLLPRPRVVLLDEPSTGLDPGVRRGFIAHLRELCDRDGITVLLTTHHLEEADRCDRVAIVDRGALVALDRPRALTAAVGGDVVVVQPVEGAGLAEKLRTRFGVACRTVDGALRIEHARGHELVRDVVDAFPDDVHAISVGRPTLEDVFVRLTGHRLATERLEEA